MIPRQFDFSGEPLQADPTGALIWPDRSTVVLADLHLGKAADLAMRGGTLLPPYDTAETLIRIGNLLARTGSDRVVALGDSFHSPDVRLSDDERQALELLSRGRDWVWVLGNHDPMLPAGLPGLTVDELSDGALIFRHRAHESIDGGEVSGHFHPKTSVRARGRRISGKCFIHDDRRLILPAFGAYTGGLDISNPAIVALFPSAANVLLCWNEAVYALGSPVPE